MEHLLSFRFKNWHGCFLFCQSLSFFSYSSHLSLNSRGVISKCADILFISLTENVGVIVLQQLPQLKQSISGHTSFSTVSINLCKPRGGCFSILVKNKRKDLLYFFTFCLNERRFTACIV